MPTTPTNSRNLEQKNIIQQFLDEGKDPFDRKNIEEIYSEKDGIKKHNQVISENEYWYAIPNLWPYKGSKQHLVIICKRNIVTITQITPVEAIALQAIQEELVENFSIVGGAFCMRFGDSFTAGTTCTRLHGHLITPEENETVNFFVGQFKNVEQ